MSACHIENSPLTTTRILNIKSESPAVKTFTFKDDRFLSAKPGQFLMLWIPGVDEIPLSILDCEQDGSVAVAVKKLGEATSALHSKRVGDIVGLRGPLGNGFTLVEGRILMVGGGTGNSPLMFLAKRLSPEKTRITFVTGAKNKEELILIDELQRLCSKDNVVTVTEDGSFGLKCLATEPVESLLGRERFDMVYACGPEQMLRKVLDSAEAHGVCFEASLERLMRCAIGLCGSCVIGKFRVCRDGPIFSGEKLRMVRKEFGVSKLDFDGHRIPV